MTSTDQCICHCHLHGKLVTKRLSKRRTGIASWPAYSCNNFRHVTALCKLSYYYYYWAIINSGSTVSYNLLSRREEIANPMIWALCIWLSRITGSALCWSDGLSSSMIHSWSLWNQRWWLWWGVGGGEERGDVPYLMTYILLHRRQKANERMSFPLSHFAVTINRYFDIIMQTDGS